MPPSPAGKHVMDRCNLTILLLPRNKGLVGWFADRKVEIVGSLPHYRRPNTDAQRGHGVLDRSIEAMSLLNAAGYGRGDPERRLTLVSNPAGAFLGASQASAEREASRSSVSMASPLTLFSCSTTCQSRDSWSG